MIPGSSGRLGDVPSEYRKAAMNVMIREANEYAERLCLPESLPITEKSLTEIHVSPPAFAERFGGLGSFRTERFSYAFGRGRRLSYITRLSSQRASVYETHVRLAIDPAAVNTERAYVLATQWLAAAFVDVQALSKTATPTVRPWRILDIVTCKYTVEWQRDGEPVAEVTLIEPTEELLVLRVEDPMYIIRPPLELQKAVDEVDAP
jgi:hypothetical protein